MDLQVDNSSHQNLCNEWVFRDVPSDITIEVDGSIFSLHKFPLVTKSGRIRKLTSEYRNSGISRIQLVSLPGGAEAFEMAAKFCYGVNFEITPANVAHLSCAAAYLEMTGDYSGDNLSSRTQEYLESVVYKRLELCLEVLTQCETLLPLADELNIVPRCIDAIASKACAEQIAISFSRLEYSGSGRLHMSRHASCEGDWWIEDLSVLRVDFYQRVIAAMKCRGVRPESIAASLVNYAQKELNKKSPSENEKQVVEAIVGLLPDEKCVIPIGFLFGLLRSGVSLDCAVACRVDLERRIGSQLEMATLDDLLIPSFRHAGDTLFDVDTVHRILVCFFQHKDESDEDGMEDESSDVFDECDTPLPPSQTSLFKVAKLLDHYLAEIAPDANLKLSKFIAIAETLPTHARTVHDSLYRAIDIYLKAHGGLSDQDKRRVCKMIDFQKLSHEAGAHAAQNERLPLQSIVQVLYFEQLKLRNSMFSPCPDDDPKQPMIQQSWRINSGALSAALSPKDNYASLRRENRELKLELTRMRMRLNDLEREHVFMKRNIEKSNSKRFASSFTKKMSKLNIFGGTSSRGSSSPTKQSQITDSKLSEGT
ncbi:unnamed protein product [Cuscuta epithymum]|uniref:Phototropic-responsive NPH3 family protein n=2 Tax=Cuscuta epithymum TaxID=186058 RepID=A0AAV0BUQ8_9ASTE|nr:unnamed protein product [Cuscuta epithymum]